MYKEGQTFIRIYEKLSRQQQQFQGVIGKITETKKKEVAPYAEETVVWYDTIYAWGGFKPRGMTGEPVFIVGTGFTQDIILDPEKHPQRVFSQIFEKAQ